MKRALVALSVLAVFACQSGPKESPVSQPADEQATEQGGTTSKAAAPKKVYEATGSGEAIAILAGGCFWCMEAPFEAIDGVSSVVSGFVGGPEKDPSYKDVAYGRTGHTEAVRITYDASKVSYELLLDVFWRNINPTQVDGQFVDQGRQYRSGIFYATDAERALAEASKKALAASGKFDKPIVTEITEAGPFYEAEEYHQDFYKKSKEHYQRYRSGSGRDQYLERVWGDEAGGYSLHGGAH